MNIYFCKPFILSTFHNGTIEKPSIISGRTVIISMRILILIFCKSTNIRGETCIFAFKQSEIAMTAKER